MARLKLARSERPPLYTPKHFDESRTEVLHDLIRSRSLATLVTLGSSGLVANHIPLVLHTDPAQPGGPSQLRGHVARANKVWQDLDASVEALAIFSGPQAYITPSWYPTKHDKGQVVPTWNYVVVHVHGKIRVIDDRDWLLKHVDELTQHQESPRSAPWHVTDAPEDFITKLAGGIVGLEMTISRIEGKWKVSQNQPEANRAGVIDGLNALGDTEAAAMSRLVKDRA